MRMTPYSAHSTGSGGSGVCSGSDATRRRRCSRTDRYFGPVTGLTTRPKVLDAKTSARHVVWVVMSYGTSVPRPAARPRHRKHQDVMTYRGGSPSHPFEG